MVSRLQSVLEQPIPAVGRVFDARPVLENDEPLVDIARYGIAGVNNGKAETAILVRQTIAERLQEINYVLATQPEVEKFFGRPVEVYVRQGWTVGDDEYATGGSIMAELRYATASRGYDAHCRMAVKGAAGERNRRACYWIMRGGLLGKDSGLVANPTNITRWSYGDQLWAALTQAPAAFYGPVQPGKN